MQSVMTIDKDKHKGPTISYDRLQAKSSIQFNIMKSIACGGRSVRSRGTRELMDLIDAGQQAKRGRQMIKSLVSMI